MSSNFKLSVKRMNDLFKRLCNKEAVDLGKSFDLANGNVMVNLEANSVRQNDSSKFSILLVKHLDVTQTIGSEIP